jgi:hypothetical protein
VTSDDGASRDGGTLAEMTLCQDGFSVSANWLKSLWRVKGIEPSSSAWEGVVRSVISRARSDKSSVFQALNPNGSYPLSDRIAGRGRLHRQDKLVRAKVAGLIDLTKIIFLMNGMMKPKKDDVAEAVLVLRGEQSASRDALIAGTAGAWIDVNPQCTTHRNFAQECILVQSVDGPSLTKLGQNLIVAARYATPSHG